MRKLFFLLLILNLFLTSYAKEDSALEVLSRQNAVVEQNIKILAMLTEGLSPTDSILIGDMLFTVDQAWEYWCHPEEREPVQPQGVFQSSVKKWINNTVPYYFDKGITSSQKDLFRKSISLWKNSTTRELNFVELNGPSGNCVRVFTDPTEYYSYSNLGMLGGVQRFHIMSNQWDSNTIAHEWGHTLGLSHEHQRMDRDNYIKFLSEQDLLKANYTPALPLSMTNEEFRVNFGLIDPGTTYDTYDYNSIMHYGGNATPERFPDKNCYYIYPFKGGFIGFCAINPSICNTGGVGNNNPSTRDIEAVRRFYGLSVVPPIPLGESVDAPSLTWSSGGNANWSGQNLVHNFGGDAVQSGRIGNNQESWLQTTVSGAGTLTFDWKVSSQIRRDYLEFSIDGIIKNHFSGEEGWLTGSYRINGSENHVLRWKYKKDGRNSAGEDYAWVDKVVWTPNRFTPPEAIRINLDLPPEVKPLEMVRIPEGVFVMGSSNNEVARYSNEGPQHQVILNQPYWLSKYEVTQAQWAALMGINPSSFKGFDRPVENISWNDCQLFIQKLNRLGQGSFRLPTEAEWEYACRAGTTTRFYWGEDFIYNQIDQYAWYSVNSSNQTQEVGLKLPNAWGLFDMSGNVWEWCQDWYRYDSYSEFTETNPQGPLLGEGKVIRGGSWNLINRRNRSANRSYYKLDKITNSIGFRLAGILSPDSNSIPTFTPTVTATPSPTVTRKPTQTPTNTPKPSTPTPTLTQSPTYTPKRIPTSTATQKPTNAPTRTPIPTSTPSNLSAYGIFDQKVDWSIRGSYKSVGNVNVTGLGDQAVYTVHGNGDDIWDEMDEGFFLYKELEGSWRLQAKVEWIDPGTSAWSKIGLMIRENATDPGSKHYWTLLRGLDHGDAFDSQWRDNNYELTSNNNHEKLFYNENYLLGLPLSIWLRVSRDSRTNVIYSEFSYDGINWFIHNSRKINMTSKASYGIAITSHEDNNLLVKARVSNVKLMKIP